MKVINKRGQQTMAIPFGMIFAILLIVVFVVIAFIAIGGFLDVGRTASVGMFYEDLQGAVDDALGSSSSEFDFDINLPKKIDSVCFANLSMMISSPGPEYDAIKNNYLYNANVFLVPPEYAQGADWKLIEHLNISKIVATRNPYCVPADGKLLIKKDFYDRLVVVS